MSDKEWEEKLKKANNTSKGMFTKWEKLATLGTNLSLVEMPCMTPTRSGQAE